MDWLTFTSKVIEAAAWPITVIVLVFRFSERFGELLGKLTEISLPGGISGKFEKSLDTAEQVAKTIETPAELQVLSAAANDDVLALNANPTGVIMEAWKGLEAVGGDLYQASDATNSDRMLMYVSKHQGVLDVLEQERRIPENEVELLRELRSIRNRAAHSKERPTPEEAERFVALVRTLELQWMVRTSANRAR
ncbi:hypothetical protein F3J19_26380 [Burkholderia sp. Ax-1724]|nr:hypothetical protein [Burkholderia sp. Ax-1724]